MEEVPEGTWWEEGARLSLPGLVSSLEGGSCRELGRDLTEWVWAQGARAPL